MQELTARQVDINDSFWSPRLLINAHKTIFHQWRQLEATNCINNFRLAAGEQDGCILRLMYGLASRKASVPQDINTSASTIWAADLFSQENEAPLFTGATAVPMGFYISIVQRPCLYRHRH